MTVKSYEQREALWTKVEAVEDKIFWARGFLRGLGDGANKNQVEKDWNTVEFKLLSYCRNKT